MVWRICQSMLLLSEISAYSAFWHFGLTKAPNQRLFGKQSFQLKQHQECIFLLTFELHGLLWCQSTLLWGMNPKDLLGIQEQQKARNH